MKPIHIANIIKREDHIDDNMISSSYMYMYIKILIAFQTINTIA